MAVAILWGGCEIPKQGDVSSGTIWPQEASYHFSVGTLAHGGGAYAYLARSDWTALKLNGHTAKLGQVRAQGADHEGGPHQCGHGSWLGVLVPSKTLADVVQRLNLAIRDAFTGLDVVQKLASIGNEPDYQTPSDFAARVRADLESWAPIVKASGFLAD